MIISVFIMFRNHEERVDVIPLLSPSPTHTHYFGFFF